MLSSEIPKPPQACQWEDLLVFGNFSSFKTFPRTGLFCLSFLSFMYLFILYISFYLLYFVLPPLEDNGLPFWVPDVLCQCSEVVLWNLVSIQMLFQWICGRESGLPILFLCYLRTTPRFRFRILAHSKYGLISLLSKGSSRVLSNTTVWKHQFFNAQPSSWSNSHIWIWLLEKS